MINNISDQLKRDEGERFFPYKDTVGKITISVGVNLSDGITQAESDYLFSNRLAAVTRGLTVIPWVSGLYQTDPIRYYVLVNMAYNLGVSGLKSFTTFLSLVQQGKYSEAAADGRGTTWAKQVGDRAVRLMDQMETGTWQ